ncbi:helix-turn-helix domain-containing protein [Propionimicrobium lymphophilum]|uniref:helix-turn-helix domain-containing protein n=1 Tax=Propionimicrobium lymphophilum TaxID=33012 RepID=UPI0023F1285E|nr:helix-turn-helix transcriptional regulator [Propionimicrobium lymphophilum]
MLTNAWYPEYCREILGARLRLANGEVTRALEETNKILDVPALPILWRIVCYTIKVSCLEILGRPVSEIGSVLDIVKWSDVPELLPTFPDGARKAIVNRLAPTEIIGSNSLEENVSVKNPSLTPRQLEILRLLATGMTQPKIAEAMFISWETVKSTCRGIYKRLNVSGRDQAVAEGKKLGMI